MVSSTNVKPRSAAAGQDDSSSRVAVYLRVSTEEQRERQSIATQREFAERYCQLHGFQVYAIYADDGISGTVPLEKRPEGARILQDARARRFDQLLVYRLDRFGRDTRLILNTVAELEQDGVRVRSMTEEFDTATPTGRLMLTLLSGFAAHEREIIRERSLAGTNRVAEAGAWLGGIVPLGYRKEGERGSGRLVLNEEPLPGFEISEAEVIRTIYRMAGEQNKSCRRIADYLNQLGVPCAYVRDDRLVVRGKRKERTSGIWRPARVRNLIISATYMGRHEYGKRSKNPGRSLIARSVPPIVSEQLWNQAQQVLRGNFLFGKRNCRNRYLLRGLMKCSLCGLTYVGVVNRRANGAIEFYYRCNGKQNGRGLYGTGGKRCPSKDVNGTLLEQVVWQDIESFVRNPGKVIEKLQASMAAEGADVDRTTKRLERLTHSLAQKTTERDRVLALYRRGRIDEKTVDDQLEQIHRQEAALQGEIDELKRPHRYGPRVEWST